MKQMAALLFTLDGSNIYHDTWKAVGDKPMNAIAFNPENQHPPFNY